MSLVLGKRYNITNKGWEESLEGEYIVVNDSNGNLETGKFQDIIDNKSWCNRLKKRIKRLFSSNIELLPSGLPDYSKYPPVLRQFLEQRL